MRILPCPAYFHQVIFIFEPHTERSSITRVRFEYEARVHPCDLGINRKVHVGAITDKWTELKTYRFWLRLLLRAEGRRERYKKQRRDKTEGCLSQLAALPF
jgi:hypothetical protein